MRGKKKGDVISQYIKYAYWLDESRLKEFLRKAESEQQAVGEARKAVCVPLSKTSGITLVMPEAWRKTELCKRPLSWYWDSPLAGHYLVISPSDLTSLGLSAQIILRASSFRAGRLPSEEEKRVLIRRESYLSAKPDAWDDLSSEDPASLERWMRVMGVRGMRYEDLFLSHCANHANFIEPVFFVVENEEEMPYSIAGTKFICSACLEFFNVIGAEFHKKLVVPCPGAVLFAGLPVNRYVEVETLGPPLIDS